MARFATIRNRFVSLCCATNRAMFDIPLRMVPGMAPKRRRGIKATALLITIRRDARELTRCAETSKVHHRAMLLLESKMKRSCCLLEQFNTSHLRIALRGGDFDAPFRRLCYIVLITFWVTVMMIIRGHDGAVLRAHAIVLCAAAGAAWPDCCESFCN